MPNPASNAWICSVCGYVHYGPRPPDGCPVCGAEPELFEPQDAAPAPQPPALPAVWRCLNCGTLADGPEPPGCCPVCDAPRERFEPAGAGAVVAPGGGAPLRAVIAGAGIAGVSAAEALRKAAPQAEIALLSREPGLPYYRLNLTRYLAGEVGADQLPLHPAAWYAEQGIELRDGAEVHGIDLTAKRAALHSGGELPFDVLILATGAHAFVPPIPGAERGHVTVLRTVADAGAILELAQPGSRCAVIGGGILGLEAAGALSRRGVQVTLVEGFGWLLPRQLNQHAAELLEAYVGSLGIALRKNAQTQEIAGDAVARAVLLQDGSRLPADLVILATGVRSNTAAARQAGLEVKQGVIVDDLLRSSHPAVYAAGDAAEHRGVSYGLWGPAQFQGAIAGMNAAGGRVEFAGIPRSNMLKVLGYNLYSIGTIRAEDASTHTLEGEWDGSYAFFAFRDNALVGSILLGDTSLSAAVKRAVEKRTDLSGLLRARPGAREAAEALRALP